MDVVEKVFTWLSNRNRKLQRQKDLKQSYPLENCSVALGMVIQPFFDGTIEVRAGSTSGVRGRSFYFSKEIHFFSCPDQNRNLYLHQALMLSAASALKIYWNLEFQSKDQADEKWSQFIPHEQRMIELVSKIHPGFISFHNELKTKYFEKLENGAPVSSEQMELFWGGLALKDTEAKGMSMPFWRRKKEDPKEDKKNTRDLEKEVEVDYESIDLKNETPNPIMHSFEKLETADDYLGGRRVEDGSDELAEHSKALDEVRLKKMTRSGESASGFIKSSVMMSLEELITGRPPEAPDCLSYPEWDQKKKRYKPRHCRLYLDPALPMNGSDLFRGALEKKYGHLLQETRRRLQRICNQPKWFSNQTDGPEIDIDAFVRHLSDIRNKLPGSAQLYRNQKKRLQDFQMLILIDSSLSTDSYVCDRRVLDVALESVGLLGLLGDGFGDNIIVARTFSETRHHCTFEILKAENEDWKCYFERADEVSPQGYTRLGPAIRHSIQILSQRRAKKKFLLILSDGKPTDFDGYEGDYGIGDIRKACLEAEAKNICAKAFAIEKSARHYFPQMFVSYEILNSPDQMPSSIVKTFLQSLK